MECYSRNGRRKYLGYGSRVGQILKVWKIIETEYVYSKLSKLDNDNMTKASMWKKIDIAAVTWSEQQNRKHAAEVFFLFIQNSICLFAFGSLEVRATANDAFMVGNLFFSFAHYIVVGCCNIETSYTNSNSHHNNGML